jgi:antirestriction protein ArdC
MPLTRDSDGRTLADITGLPQDAQYKIYRSGGVPVYFVNGTEYQDIKDAERDLLDSGVAEENLDDAISDATFYLIEPGEYALPDDADTFNFIDRVGRFRLDNKKVDNLTSEEFAAMREYTSSSDKLNSELRQGNEPPAKISLIDSLMQKLGERVFGPLFRGVNFSPGEWENQNLKVGDKISDPAFMSTTKDRSVADRFSLSSVEYATGVKSADDSSVKVVYKINLSPEEKALKIDAKFLPPASESEFILPRGISFEVVNISEDGRFKVVELKQLSEAEAGSPDLNQGLPGVANAESRISADALKGRIDTLFDRLRADLISLPKSGPEEASKSEVTTKVAEDVATNKSVVASVLQEVKDAFKSPAQWIKNFTNRDRQSPINPLSNQEYKAFNLVALSAAADRAGFADPRWLTKNEAQKQYGANLKSDAVSTRIAVPILHSYEDENGNKFESVRFQPVEVYNAEQFDGMPSYEEPETLKYTPKEAFETILDRFNRAEIERGRRGAPSVLGMKIDDSSINPDTGRPIRSPNYSRDRIKLPLRSQFKSDEAWIQSLSHELIHSTGALFRQNRSETQQAGTDPIARAKEEVIAEMASAILMKAFGLDYDTKNSANYIKTQALKEALDDEDLLDASIKAQAAIDYMLGNDVDTMPRWNPSNTKNPKTPTEFRNTELTPLYSSVNPEPSQTAVSAMNLTEDPDTDLNQDAAPSASQKAVEKVINALKDKIESIGFGTAPWRKPYKDGFEFVGGSGLPRNPKTKHIYSGTNAFALRIFQSLGGFKDSRWLTYNQAQEVGGQVRKGEKGVPILVPRVGQVKGKDGKPELDKNGTPRTYVFFTSAAVFNVEQIDGLNLTDDVPTTTMAPLDAQNFILDRYQRSLQAKGLTAPEIVYSYIGEYGDHFGSSSPNWSPTSDKITLPQEAQFTSPEEWFETLMHELTHSTGHISRLDRTNIINNYSTDRSARGLEELVAELGAAALGEIFGVNYDFDNTSAYLEGWQKAISETDLSSFQTASALAQQAVDYILGVDLGDWSPIEGYKVSRGGKSNAASQEEE